MKQFLLVLTVLALVAYAVPSLAQAVADPTAPAVTACDPAKCPTGVVCDKCQGKEKCECKKGRKARRHHKMIMNDAVSDNKPMAPAIMITPAPYVETPVVEPTYRLLYEYNTKTPWHLRTIVKKTPYVRTDDNRGAIQTNGYGLKSNNVRVFDVVRPLIQE